MLDDVCLSFGFVPFEPNDTIVNTMCMYVKVCKALLGRLVEGGNQLGLFDIRYNGVQPAGPCRLGSHDLGDLQLPLRICCPHNRLVFAAEVKWGRLT